MQTNRFGQITSAIDLAVKIREHLKVWTPDYIADIAESSGRARGDLPAYQSYMLSTELEKMTEQALPACVIFVPAIEPDYNDGRKDSGVADVRIGSFVQGTDTDVSIELAMLYDANVHAIGVQHPGWGGDPRANGYKPFAGWSQWAGSRYDLVPLEESRQLGAAVTMFHVGVSGMVSSADGSTAPSEDPLVDPGAWPLSRMPTIEVNWKG